jgi:hypothetical protein
MLAGSATLATSTALASGTTTLATTNGVVVTALLATLASTSLGSLATSNLSEVHCYKYS